MLVISNLVLDKMSGGMMDEVIIELKNVYYSYEDNNNSALNDINLKIKKGEVIAVMGANGSGKSTLFFLSFFVT